MGGGALKKIKRIYLIFVSAYHKCYNTQSLSGSKTLSEAMETGPTITSTDTSLTSHDENLDYACLYQPPTTLPAHHSTDHLALV